MALGSGLNNGNGGSPMVSPKPSFKPYTGGEVRPPGGGGGLGGGGEVGPPPVEFGNVQAGVDSLHPPQHAKDLGMHGLSGLGKVLRKKPGPEGEGPAGEAGTPAEGATEAGVADLGAGAAEGGALESVGLIGGLI
jgi:hypothetical protein